MARSVLDFFGLGKERVRMLSGDGTDPEAFARQMKDFEERLKGLGKSALRKKRPADLTAIDIKEGGKRALFHTLIAGFAEKTGVREGRLEGELPVGFVTVDEKECTLCGSCAFHCGTGALRHEGDEVIDIYYNHSLCIGCGLCQEICPEKVIKMERVLDLKPFLEREERKFEVPIISCSQCGKPIMAEAAMRKLKGRLKERGLEMLDMCQSCTDRVTVADLVGAKPDEITIFQQGKAPWDS
ncbi:MAG: hypothetical protein D6733_00085 [Methanobacteriota archaeon]|nr:MAG: hypothetical protein D6733_00085 [Euryarchaeota archaeon]